jgi:hypothetical protein
MSQLKSLFLLSINFSPSDLSYSTQAAHNPPSRSLTPSLNRLSSLPLTTPSTLSLIQPPSRRQHHQSISSPLLAERRVQGRIAYRRSSIVPEWKVLPRPERRMSLRKSATRCFRTRLWKQPRLAMVLGDGLVDHGDLCGRNILTKPAGMVRIKKGLLRVSSDR